MRISIEVTSEQHKMLKARAALCGQSIKDYVLERVFPNGITISGDGLDAEQIQDLMQPENIKNERGSDA